MHARIDQMSVHTQKKVLFVLVREKMDRNVQRGENWRRGGERENYH